MFVRRVSFIGELAKHSQLCFSGISSLKLPPNNIISNKKGEALIMLDLQTKSSIDPEKLQVHIRHRIITFWQVFVILYIVVLWRLRRVVGFQFDLHIRNSYHIILTILNISDTGKITQKDVSSTTIQQFGMSFPIFGSREQNHIQQQYACRIEQNGYKYHILDRDYQSYSISI